VTCHCCQQTISFSNSRTLSQTAAAKKAVEVLAQHQCFCMGRGSADGVFGRIVADRKSRRKPRRREVALTARQQASWPASKPSVPRVHVPEELCWPTTSAASR